MYGRVAHRVTPECKAVLDTLLVKPPDSAVTSFNRLKQAPRACDPQNGQALDRAPRVAGRLDQSQSAARWHCAHQAALSRG